MATDRFNGVVASKAIKVRCALGAEANVAVLQGAQTIEGVILLAGDRVLLTAQTNPVENGAWDIVDPGLWTRSPDWDGNRDIEEGSTVWAGRAAGNDKLWQVQTSGVIQVGTTAVTITELIDPDVAVAVGLDAVTTVGDDTLGNNIIISGIGTPSLTLKDSGSLASTASSDIIFTDSADAEVFSMRVAANAMIIRTDTASMSFNLAADNVMTLQTNIVRVNTDSGGFFEIRDDIGNNVQITTTSTSLIHNFTTNVKNVRYNDGISILMEEKAAAEVDVANFGQFWVRNDAPNVPMFTDDLGNDFELNAVIVDGGATNDLLYWDGAAWAHTAGELEWDPANNRLQLANAHAIDWVDQGSTSVELLVMSEILGSWGKITDFTQIDSSEFLKTESASWAWNSDGTKGYVCVKGVSNNGVWMGTVTGTAYDPVDSNSPVNILAGKFSSMALSADGTKVYLALDDGIDPKIEERPNSGTAGNPGVGDIGAATTSFDTGTSSIRGMHFKADGLTGWFTTAGPTIYQFDMSVAWDLSTAVLGVTKNFGASPLIMDLAFSPDGLTAYLGATTLIHEYVFGTAFDISTMTDTGRQISSLTGIPGTISWGFDVSPDGNTLIVQGKWDNNAANNDSGRWTSTKATETVEGFSVGDPAFPTRIDGLDVTLAQAGTVVLSTDADGIIVKSSVYVDELTAAAVDVAGRGQIWVRADTPNVLMYTDDAGTDFQIGGTGTPQSAAPINADTWLFEAVTNTGGAPAANSFRMASTAPSASSQLAFDDTSDGNGFDIGDMLNDLTTDSMIEFYDPTDPQRFWQYLLTAAPTDMTGWWQLNVVAKHIGVLNTVPADGTPMLLKFHPVNRIDSLYRGTRKTLTTDGTVSTGEVYVLGSFEGVNALARVQFMYESGSTSKGWVGFDSDNTMQVRTNITNGTVFIRGTSGGTVTMGQFVSNGPVYLYNNNVWKFNTAATGVSVRGVVSMLEQAAAPTNIATFGQLWVKDDAPNTLWFTDDAGNDFSLLDVGASPQTISTNWASSGSGSMTSVSGFTNTVNSGATFEFDDNATLDFGTGNDVTFAFDAVNMVINAILGTTEINVTGFAAMNLDAPLMMLERASAKADVANYGQLWVRSDIANTLMFTDDAGGDQPLSIVFTSTEHGLVPLSGGGTTNYLRADGTWAAPPGAGSGVTSVSAGNGMTFTTITATGAVTMGTPGSLSSSSTNAVTADSHTHAITSLDAGDIVAGNLVTGVLPYSTATATASAFKCLFINTTGNVSGNFALQIDSSNSFTYNPSTNTLAATNINATAMSATFTGNGAAVTNLNAGNISTGAVAVLRGGTGTTTITGSGANVLASNPGLGAFTCSGTFGMADNILDRPRIKDYCIESDSPTVGATAVTLTYTNGPAFDIDMEPATGAVVITITGGPPSGTYGQITVKIRQDGTAARTISFTSGTFLHAGGTLHPMNTTLNGISIYTLETWDAGTTWHVSGADYS